METATSVFDERRQELLQYLALQEQREKGLLGHSTDDALSTNVNRSACLLMIYTLLEASISECLEAVKRSITAGKYHIGELIPELGGSIARERVKTLPQMEEPSRIFEVYQRFSALVDNPALPVGNDEKIVLHKSGGNYNLKQIFKACRAVGIELRNMISEQDWEDVCKQQQIIDQLVHKRNRIAHGTVTLSEEGATLSLPDLERYLTAVDTVMQAVTTAFIQHINERSFLSPADELPLDS